MWTPAQLQEMRDHLDKAVEESAKETARLRRNKLRNERDELARDLLVHGAMMPAEAYNNAEEFIAERERRWKGFWPDDNDAEQDDERLPESQPLPGAVVTTWERK